MFHLAQARSESGAPHKGRRTEAEQPEEKFILPDAELPEEEFVLPEAELPVLEAELPAAPRTPQWLPVPDGPNGSEDALVPEPAVPEPAVPEPAVPEPAVPEPAQTIEAEVQTLRMELRMLPAWPTRRTVATQTAPPSASAFYHMSEENETHVFPNVLGPNIDPNIQEL